MDLQKVPLKSSIGLELITKVFGIYCLAAIIITLIQMYSEYSQTREHVIENMVEHQPMVEQALASATWHLDLPLLNSVVNGILAQNVITGVVVLHESGTVIAEAGNTAQITKSNILPTEVQKLAVPAMNTHPNLHRFALFDPNDLSTAPIGYAVFATSNDVVLEVLAPSLYSLFLAAVIKTTILWVLFLYFGRKLLGRPLNHLTATIAQLPLDEFKLSKKSPKKFINELELFEYTLSNLENKLEQTLFDLKESNEKLSHTNVKLLRAVEQSPTISIIFSTTGEVKYATPSFTKLTGFSNDEVEILFNQYFKKLSFKRLVKQFERGGLATELISDEITVIGKKEQPIYLSTRISPVCTDDGKVECFLFSANDISKIKRLEIDLTQKNAQQQETIFKLNETRAKLLQSEKMASIGQLAAGVAHEINNPVGFINSNIDTLDTYIINLLDIINLYGKAAGKFSEHFTEATQLKEEIDFDFLKEDIPCLLTETKEGLVRVKKIVQDLMSFSREDNAEVISYDILEGLDSTLNIARHEIKYKAEIIKEYDEVPAIECIPAQVNQVFMNLMINAAQAIEIKGIITLRVKLEQDQVIVEIEDNGPGIKPENLNKLFDPFFTTKPVGKGTGLGLSVSYSIIQKHNGQITVDSKLGKGTCFRISLPIRQPSNTKQVQQSKAVC